MSGYKRTAPSSYPGSTAEQKVWLASRWPWIDVDLGRIHPDAFAPCLPVFEKLARNWPAPFTALRRLKVTPESAGWPDTSARAWYDGKGGIHLREERWSCPADAERCEYTISHEFGHHIAGWLWAKDEMRDVVEKFISENFELGKKISDYAAISPNEAWADGFEELHNRPKAQWHEYTQRQANFLAPWKVERSRLGDLWNLIVRRSTRKL
jgi:hypothetical protein